MTEAARKTYADFTLPPSLVSKIDVSRMVGEAERIDSALTTESVRAKTGAAQEPRPALSQSFEDFLTQNGLSLANSQERSELVRQLRLLKDNLPVIHMTFAVKADPESLQQLMAWLRQSVHPQAVISVGLQPALIAGVYLRTSNKVMDLSLRAKLEGSHDLLVKELGALRGRS
jgi:hypothetical protein